MSLVLYLIVSGAVFFMVAVFHLLRLLYHWPVFVGSWTIPQWLSVIGFPVSSGYTVWALWLLRTRLRDRSVERARDHVRS